MQPTIYYKKLLYSPVRVSHMDHSDDNSMYIWSSTQVALRYKYLGLLLYSRKGGMHLLSFVISKNMVFIARYIAVISVDLFDFKLH